MKATIYHNPRCSKSRATLALLEERNLDIEIVDYLNSPPSGDEVLALLGKLGVAAIEIVRTGETEFRESGLERDAAPEALIDLITTAPRVLQRPIVVVGDKARIGRPPEQVLDIIG